MPLSLKDQLKEKDREIAILHAIAGVVSSTQDLDELLQKFCTMIIEHLSADSVLIYLFDENREELILRGSDKPHSENVGAVKLKLGEGITGWVAEKRKIVAISRHASDDPRFKSFSSLQEDRYEAFISVPITMNDELLGVMNIHHKKAHTHSPIEIKLAERIVEEIGGAIANTHLRSQAQKKTRQIEVLTKMSMTIAQGTYLREILQLIVSMTAEDGGLESLFVYAPVSKRQGIKDCSDSEP